jgi:hypothetical protein
VILKTSTRENSFPVQAGVVRVREATGTATAGVCVAVIGNTNVTKVRTATKITRERSVLLFGVQRKCPRREIVRILQRKNKILETRIYLPAVVL